MLYKWNTRLAEQKESSLVQHVLLEYDYDHLHSTVIPSYWDNEIRRALFQAGIHFDPDSVESFGSDSYSEHSAAGFNVTCISFEMRYDLLFLKDILDKHSVNFHVRTLSEIPVPLRVSTVTYRMKLPKRKDRLELSAFPEQMLNEKEWNFTPRTDAIRNPCPINLRNAVQKLSIRGDDLLIIMGPEFTDPRSIFRFLFRIPHEESLSQIPERIGFTYENRGVFDLAMTRGSRDAFLKYKEAKTIWYNSDFDDMTAYISSESCVRDLKKFIQRDYTMPPPYHYRVAKNFSDRKRDIYSWKGSFKYLMKLIVFVLRRYDHIFSDGLYSFRTSRSGKDFLMKIREQKDINQYYVVKLDVSNYVASIVPELLFEQLSMIWKDDPAFLDLLKYLLFRRECIEKNGQTVSCETGGLGGFPIANLFMNIYLMELDEYFYPKAVLYARYSDDIIIFARSRKEAEEYLSHLLAVLEQKKLSTNTQKTCLIEPGKEVEILGCKLINGKMDISDHAKKKIKRKIRKHANYLLQQKKKKGSTDIECARRMIQYCNRIFFGQAGNNALTWSKWIFPVITDTSSLKEIDHYVQDAIRYVTCGSMAKKRFRITYNDLQKLGYKSIVNAYYHFKRL